MKRALYVSLIFAMLTSVPLEAQRTKNTIRPVKQLDVINMLAGTPAYARDAFVALLLNAQRRLGIDDKGSINTPKNGGMTVNGVLGEPLGDEEQPPPPPPQTP
jgi:hypothetical protein